MKFKKAYFKKRGSYPYHFSDGLNSEEKKFRTEEEKENKKKLDADKKRCIANNQELRNISNAMQTHTYELLQIRADIELLKYIPEQITVLFLATNPLSTDRLRLDEEARSIQEVIRKSKYRDLITFETRWAVRPLDILQAINELNPDIVHFSAHGVNTGELILQNSDGSHKLVTKEAITQTIMAASDKIRLIFFNSCFSFEQALNIVKYVDAAIGMTTSVTDAGACAFSSQFYSSLGFGFSLQKSFDQAKAVLMLENSSEENTPVLFTKNGIKGNDVFLVKLKDGE